MHALPCIPDNSILADIAGLVENFFVKITKSSLTIAETAYIMYQASMWP
jgi:hypothetical protein